MWLSGTSWFWGLAGAVFGSVCFSLQAVWFESASQAQAQSSVWVQSIAFSAWGALANAAVCANARPKRNRRRHSAAALGHMLSHVYAP